MTTSADTKRLQLINDYAGLTALRTQAVIAERDGDPALAELAARIGLASSVLDVYEGMPLSQEITGRGSGFGELGLRSTIMATTAPGERLSHLAQGRYAKIQPTIDYRNANIVDLNLCWRSPHPSDASADDGQTIQAIYAAGGRLDGPLASMFDKRVLVCVHLDDALAVAKAWITQAIIPDAGSVAQFPNAHHYKAHNPPTRSLADHGLAYPA